MRGGSLSPVLVRLIGRREREKPRRRLNLGGGGMVGAHQASFSSSSFAPDEVRFFLMEWSDGHQVRGRPREQGEDKNDSLETEWEKRETESWDLQKAINLEWLVCVMEAPSNTHKKGAGLPFKCSLNRVHFRGQTIGSFGHSFLVPPASLVMEIESPEPWIKWIQQQKMDHPFVLHIHTHSETQVWCLPKRAGLMDQAGSLIITQLTEWIIQACYYSEDWRKPKMRKERKKEKCQPTSCIQSNIHTHS